MGKIDFLYALANSIFFRRFSPNEGFKPKNSRKSAEKIAPFLKEKSLLKYLTICKLLIIKFLQIIYFLKLKVNKCF
ncbi:MAG: hypothetical protein RIS64_2892 [Bacteroidota bacterium]|jgi:hypothetical protein